MVTFLLMLFGLVAVCGVLVAYGTLAKNRWGINLAAVFCPRCKAAAPTPPQPRSLRQARWGEWTCPACGAEVDKWGRELVSGMPREGGMEGAQTRTVLRKKFIIATAAGFFVLTLVLDWMGWGGGGGKGWRFPSTWAEAVVQVGLATVETAFFTTLFFFAMKYLFQRLFVKEKGRDPERRRGSDRDQDP
jgi:hypothetical protein